MATEKEGHHLQGVDVLGITVAGTLATSATWYDHAIAALPAPTTVYAVLGALYLIIQILDKVGLLPTWGRKPRAD